MPFLSHHALEEEPFSKVLFYSVFIHYMVFFALFGNPFLVLSPPKPGGSSQKKQFSVNLLSLPAGREGEDEGSFRARHPTMRVEGEAPALEAPESEESRKGRPAPSQEDDLKPAPKPLHSEAALAPLETKPTEKPSVAAPKQPPLRMPPSMTGPEDCMLKVVGMVCPNGEVGCIAAYRDFCATLPE